MNSYKIRINVEIVESDEPITPDPKQIKDGLFEFNISSEQATSIDDCEEAILRANYPALRAAISQHLEDVSKKKLKPKPEVAQ